MSPELSAKMEIKRAVSGPTASQSDSHVNNIGGICCNLGIIYAAPPQPIEGKKGQFVLWRLKWAFGAFRKKRPVLATVRALWGEPKQAHALPAPRPGPSSENHYSTICLSRPWHIYTSHLWHLNGKQMQKAFKEMSDPPLGANGSKVWTLPLRGLTLPAPISSQPPSSENTIQNWQPWPHYEECQKHSPNSCVVCLTLLCCTVDKDDTSQGCLRKAPAASTT